MCVERFVDYPQLGRFTLRDEGKTVAIGKVSLIAREESSRQPLIPFFAPSQITKLVDVGTIDEAAEGVANLSVSHA